MDPMQPFLNGQPIPFTQSSSIFVPGVYANIHDGDDYLASLDSDTRDYVLKHTDEPRSRQDIIDCVNKLRNGG
jgi:hypothetical protein